jgi:cysteine desulfurase
MSKRVYLDYSATTPVDRKILKAMMPFFSEKFGNPLTIHRFGSEAADSVQGARNEVANFLNCQDKEVIFTSGATESNNFVIKGVLRDYYLKNKRIPHIITSVIEHNSILDTCRKLEKEKKIEVTYVPVTSDGIVKVEAVKKAIKKNTILVSIMQINNEIGTIQPIKEIGKIIEVENKKRLKKKKREIIFHSDATQGINYLNIDVNKLSVHLLSFSGHKIYAPKGVGVLYRKIGTSIKPLFDGGGHEGGLRAGTHNVPGIVGLGEAIKMLKNKNTKFKNKEIKRLRDYLIKRVLKEIPNSHLNGSKVERSPGNANFRFDDVEGESLILSLDMEGIAAGTGSACSSGSLEPSHVLMSLGLKHEQAHGSLRLSLGKYTTKKEIDYTINILKKELNRLRKISGDVLKSFK